MRALSRALCTLILLALPLPGSQLLAAVEGDSAGLRERIESVVRMHAGGPVDRIELPNLSRFTRGIDFRNLRVEVVASGKLNRDRLAIRVSLWRAARLVKRGVITAKLHASRLVVVARHDLRSRSRISQSDVALVAKPLSELRSDSRRLTEQVVGLRLRRTVREGQILRSAFVEHSPAVSRGQRVRLVLRSGALRIEGRGKSQEDGRRGEWIRVLNQTSRREVIGLVVGDGVVHVDL